MSIRNGLIYFVTFLLILALADSAQAACSSPAGNAGQHVYNSAQKILQYCDGTNWLAMNKPGSGSGGCAAPVGTEGTVLYNTDHHVMQVCSGAQWVPMGPMDDEAAGVSTAGLVGHWKLDETSGTTANDSAGSNNGTMNGGLDAGNDSVAGVVKTALDFDGADDCVVMSSYDPNFNAEAVTVSLWYKPLTSSFASNKRLYQHDNNAFGIRSNSITNAIEFFTDTGNDGGTWKSVSFLDLDLVPINQWYHLVGVYDGAAIKAYLDGTEVASQPQSGQVNNPDDPPSIGCEGATGLQNIQADIDDVRIYSRALSDTEIQNMYYAHSLNAGLVGHWKLDDGAGVTATDSSGNGNDGTLTNMDPATDWVPGVKNGALEFDGVAFSSVQIPYDATLTPSNFTLALWLRPDDLSVIRGFFKGAGGNGYNNSFRMVNDGFGRLNARCSDGVDPLSATNSSVLPLHQWTHGAMTYDGTTLRLYSNGVEVASDNVGGCTYSNSDLAKIGEVAGEPPTIGLIDDVRLYSRALSAGEIQRLYGCTSPAYVEGTMLYNPSWTVMQYCNGINWVAMGKKAPATADCPNIGNVCVDGTVYAGLTPDGNVRMFTTAADAGQYTWNNGNTSGYVSTGQTSTITGNANTEAIIGFDSDSGTAGSQPHQAAEYCANLSANGHNDWYLPAKDELNVLYTNKAAIGGFDTSGTIPTGYYWSSSEFSSSHAGLQNFNDGTQGALPKHWNFSVRCVRRY